MTFSCPSFLAAATSAFMPPQLATVTQLAQLTLFPPPPPALDELLPPHPAASSAPLSATAATARVLLLRTIPLRLVEPSVRTEPSSRCRVHASCSAGYARTSHGWR